VGGWRRNERVKANRSEEGGKGKGPLYKSGDKAEKVRLLFFLFASKAQKYL